MKLKKWILKIIAGAVALLLIAGILSITNSLVGNPISAYMAEKAIKSYVAQNYSFLDVEVGKARYNFKFSEYMAKARSRTSIDTHFTVYYRGGKVRYDDYESNVLGKFNTLQRWEGEYSALAKSILAKVDGLEKNSAMVVMEKWEYEKVNDRIKLDMSFDRKLPVEVKAIIRVDLTDNSIKNIAQLLEKSHAALKDNQCIFRSYDVFSEYNGVLVMVSDVTPADIESGQLEALLENAKANENDEGIRVYIKSDKK